MQKIPSSHWFKLHSFTIISRRFTLFLMGMDASGGF